MAQFFDIFSIDEGENKYRFCWSPDEIGIQYHQSQFDYDIVLDLVCFRRGLDITCTGWVATTVELECVRCLERFLHKLREPIDFAVRLTTGAPKQVELWNEDIISLDRFAGRIDIAPRIRDALILGIPPYPICSKHCRGLCPVCGANMNETECGHNTKNSADPRWEKLATLMKTKKKDNA